MKEPCGRVTMGDVDSRADSQAPASVADAGQPGTPATRAGEVVTQPEPPERMLRRRSGRAIAGVAGGLADHLGVNVLWVRVAFAVLAAFGGAGLLAYGLLWVFAPQQPPETYSAALSRKERQQAFGLIALGIGLTVGIGTLSGTISGWVAGSLGVTIVGVVVVWREADESQRRRWKGDARTGVLGAVLGGGGSTALVRVLAGAGLVVSGIAAFVLSTTNATGDLQFAVFAVLAALIGVGVLTVPWWLRLVRDLGEERRARIRTEERAEIAAHLHDSVLQTLALIQKQSDQPREVQRLARGQERQLRGWLYGPSGYGRGQSPSSGASEQASTGPQVQQPTMLSEALASACGEVEDTFAVQVQQVVVGDIAMTEQLTALVQAAREAMVNSAKHSGEGEVSVYAEAEHDRVTVFVRDRGKGFDEQEVPGDRHGLANSIRGRMERNGGEVRLRTAPGEGTEVQLSIVVDTASSGAVDANAESEAKT
ncbi:MAG: PspC domain-containing protein [Pseudonocardiaceae bacterium]|nr:PspC domain-containing protein [Pseudonocardiaceae bacterium]